MLLSVLTKNLNWESLTKSLLFILILWGSLKKLFFRGEGVYRLKGGGGLGVG